MKNFIKLTVLLLSFFMLSSNKSKESIKNKYFVNTKWRIDNPAVKTTVCFKSDNTFWHYYNKEDAEAMRMDSSIFCRWGVENEKIYLFEDTNVNVKFQFMEIVSCKKDLLVLKYLEGGKLVTLINKGSN